MLRAFLRRLTSRSDRDEDADEESGGSRFAGSLLDWSVRYSHGERQRDAERELASIDAKARRLEEERRED